MSTGQKMILNINQLRAFHTAARLKSITLAARELMVTPPAISMHVKQLEATLDVRLMVRAGNSIQLTEQGKAVFRRCDRIFRQIKDLEDFFEDMSRAKSGVLRIGCPQTPAKYLMPRLIGSFNKTYPGIRIVLDQGSSSEMTRSILDRKNELAVVRFRREEGRLKVKIFGREELVLIAAPKSQHLSRDEISVTELSNIPLIVPKEGSATHDVVFEYLRKFQVVPKIVLESGSTDLIKELVSQDNGVSLLVRVAVQDDLKSRRLRSIRIQEGPPTLEYGIGYLKRAPLSPGASAFLHHLDEVEEIIPSPK